MRLLKPLTVAVDLVRLGIKTVFFFFIGMQVLHTYVRTHVHTDRQTYTHAMYMPTAKARTNRATKPLSLHS
ncbi:hypothetical protein BGZ63DRAFT_383915, partial [Mariannaea sp. PMI_226]